MIGSIAGFLLLLFLLLPFTLLHAQKLIVGNTSSVQGLPYIHIGSRTTLSAKRAGKSVVLPNEPVAIESVKRRGSRFRNNST